VPGTDRDVAERLEIINFCDAAGEWGSIVPIPASEANRMIALAEQRQIADFQNGQREQREPLGSLPPWAR
jgi:hypothetical protein